jgi:hypothetical protein
MIDDRKRPLTDVLAEHLGRALTPSEKKILELAEVILDGEEDRNHKEASAGE